MEKVKDLLGGFDKEALYPLIIIRFKMLTKPEAGVDSLIIGKFHRFHNV